MELYNALGGTKFESRRSGGSSGCIHKLNGIDPNVKKLIHTPGSVARAGIGAIWIEGYDCWYIYYMNTTACKMKQVKNTNPVPDGCFKMKETMLQQWSFITCLSV